MDVNYLYLSFKELCALGSIKQKTQNNKEAKKEKNTNIILTLKYIMVRYQVWDFGGGAGEKISMFSHEVSSKFIRFGRVSLLNLGST